MNDKLKLANSLQREIKDLEHFITTVTEFDELSNSIPSVSVFMTKVVNVKISFFGSRFFRTGAHSQTIAIPDNIRNGMLDLVKARLKELNERLSAMFS